MGGGGREGGGVFGEFDSFQHMASKIVKSTHEHQNIKNINDQVREAFIFTSVSKNSNRY